MILHPTIQPTVPKRAPKNMVLGFRACHRDLRSRSGFRWGFPGQWTHAEGPFRGDTILLHGTGTAQEVETVGLDFVHTTEAVYRRDITSVLVLRGER